MSLSFTMSVLFVSLLCLCNVHSQNRFDSQDDFYIFFELSRSRVNLKNFIFLCMLTPFDRRDRGDSVLSILKDDKILTNNSDIYDEVLLGREDAYL